MKMHYRFPKMKISTQIVLIFVLVCFLVGHFLFCFSNVFTSKMMPVAELTISKYIDSVASNFKMYSLGKNSSDEFLLVTENGKGEITSIDYDMEHIYELAGDFTELIESSMNENIDVLPYQSFDFKKQDSDGIVLALPFGIVSDSVLFSNLGPNIPVFIHFIDSVLSQVKTNVTDYGINNVLLEVYLNVKISYEIVSPVMEEEKTLEYQLLMDSKVIQGVVPNWFSGAYQSQTTFFEVSFP